MPSIYRWESFKTGQIALPFIILVSGIIIEVAIAGSFIAYFLSNSGLGDRLALRAEVAAQAGIDDAMARITQNKEYAPSGTTYTLPVGSDSAVVTISRTVNVPANIYLYTITVTATAGTRQKKFLATMTADRTTGQIQLQSIVELTVS